MTLRPEKDQLWWPHGHGRATLHQLEVTFEDRRESTCSVKQPEVGARSSGESGATPFISSLWRTVGRVLLLQPCKLPTRRLRCWDGDLCLQTLFQNCSSAHEHFCHAFSQYMISVALRTR